MLTYFCCYFFFFINRKEENRQMKPKDQRVNLNEVKPLTSSAAKTKPS